MGERRVFLSIQCERFDQWGMETELDPDHPQDTQEFEYEKKTAQGQVEYCEANGGCPQTCRFRKFAEASDDQIRAAFLGGNLLK